MYPRPVTEARVGDPAGHVNFGNSPTCLTCDPSTSCKVRRLRQYATVSGQPPPNPDSQAFLKSNYPYYHDLVPIHRRIQASPPYKASPKTKRPKIPADAVPSLRESTPLELLALAALALAELEPVAALAPLLAAPPVAELPLLPVALAELDATPPAVPVAATPLNEEEEKKRELMQLCWQEA